MMRSRREIEKEVHKLIAQDEAEERARGRTKKRYITAGRVICARIFRARASSPEGTSAMNWPNVGASEIRSKPRRSFPRGPDFGISPFPDSRSLKLQNAV